MAKKKETNDKEKRFKALLIVELVLLIIVITGAILATVAKNYMGKIERDKDFNVENIKPSNTNSDVIQEYTNIAVFGWIPERMS